MADGTRMQQRRATEAVWATSSYVLAPGELGVSTDAKIIKIGNGTSPWSELDIAFGSEYLPLLGTASNSDLLEGIGASGFVKVVDTTTAATADKVVMRDGSGRAKAATGVSTDDVVNYAQMVAADSAGIISSRQSAISRTVSAAFTVALADIGGIIVVNNSSYTHFTCTIPANATVSIPVGSWFSVLTSNKGPTKLTAAAGVTLRGVPMIYGGYSTARILKIATDEWAVVNWQPSPAPIFKSFVSLPRSITNGSFTPVVLGGTDPAPAATGAVDSLGANEQWSSSFNTRVFARREGYYMASAQVAFSNIVTRVSVNISVNGVTNWGGSIGTGSVNEQSAVLELPNLKMNLGDYVEMTAYQESAGSQNLVNSAYAPTFFSWRWVRPFDS
jgi:hypothetical protein